MDRAGPVTQPKLRPDPKRASSPDAYLFRGDGGPLAGAFSYTDLLARGWWLHYLDGGRLMYAVQDWRFGCYVRDPGAGRVMTWNPGGP